jgi:uncharacterized protein YukE
MDDFQVNTDALHQSAQRLRNIIHQNSTAHIHTWVQTLDYQGQLVSEMYGPYVSFADLWQTQIQTLYKLHEELAKHLDEAATSYENVERDIARSFETTNGPRISGAQ